MGTAGREVKKSSRDFGASWCREDPCPQGAALTGTRQFPLPRALGLSMNKTQGSWLSHPLSWTWSPLAHPPQGTPLIPPSTLGSCLLKSLSKHVFLGKRSQQIPGDFQEMSSMEAQPPLGNKLCCPGLSPARWRHLWQEGKERFRPAYPKAQPHQGLQTSAPTSTPAARQAHKWPGTSGRA